MRTTDSLAAKPQSISGIDVLLLEQLFDVVTDVAFFVKDADGRYVSVNQSLVTRHGLQNKNEAIGRTPCEICHGDFGMVPTTQDQAVLKTGRPLIDHLECQWHLPNQPVWCLTTKLPVRDASGAVIGIIGISRDVKTKIDIGTVPGEFAGALEILEKQLLPEATPAWLARRSRLTPQRLARLTKRAFDLSPSQLICKTRMDAASRLLVDTSEPVAQIAHECGFSDHSAFTRAFRSATGFTPTEFRAQMARRSMKPRG